MRAKKVPIPASLPFEQRIVGSIPIDHLFTEAGRTAHVRGDFLTPEAVEALLRVSRDLRLVEARIGSQLCWYPRGDYSFWYRRASRHAADPDNRKALDEFPVSTCYFVSEWLDSATDDRVLLYEEHH